MSEETLVLTEPLEELPPVNLVGQNGNAFNIIGLCQRASRNKYTKEQWDNIKNQMMSGDYDNLLQIAMKYFDVS